LKQVSWQRIRYNDYVPVGAPATGEVALKNAGLSFNRVIRAACTRITAIDQHTVQISIPEMSSLAFREAKLNIYL